MAEKTEKKTRALHLFTVPRDLAKDVGVREVGLVVLTSAEELMCFKRAKGDSAALAMELTKTALREIDGKPMSTGDESTDTFWAQADARLRQLILSAYAEIHAAKEEDTTSFLQSRKVRLA